MRMTDEEIEAAKAALADQTRRYRRASATRKDASDKAMTTALDLLRAGVSPAEVARLSPFTDAYIRKTARDAGIPPARVSGFAREAGNQ